MLVFKSEGELSCGVNNDGDLYLGDSKSGYCLKDTPENRDVILKEFDKIKRFYEVIK